MPVHLQYSEAVVTKTGPGQPAARSTNTCGAVRAGRFLAPVLVASAALAAFAPTAAADEAAYLGSLQEQLRFLSADELLSLGYDACSIIGQGQPGSVAADMLADKRGVGVNTAATIVLTATVNLDC